jgi:YegS/Rv2252/BmrU family lipid kinase
VRVAVIVNLLAGGRRRSRHNEAECEAVIARAAASAGATAVVLLTRGPGGGRVRAREAITAGVDLVVAWGGDGTVNEVASVLAGGRVPLGIVPGGSGNGLARELGIPRDPLRALATAFRLATRPIDVGMIGDRAFVNVAGFGFDAHIAQLFNWSGTSRGLLRYALLTLREIARYPPRRYSVRWDGGGFDGTALFLAFANSRQYGNGMCVAPQAQLDDGLFDLVIVQPTTTLGDLWRARRLFTRTILRDRRIQFVRAREATVWGDAPLLCHVDGESISGLPSVDVCVRPHALRVCAAAEGSGRIRA